MAARLVLADTLPGSWEAGPEDLEQVIELEQALKTSQEVLRSIVVGKSISQDAKLLKAKEYLIAIKDACHKRRFFHLETDGQLRVALGPGLMEYGDLVVLLHGGSWPAILRAAGEQYTWIGWAYVQGIMHGEAWKEIEESSRGWEVSNIR